MFEEPRRVEHRAEGKILREQIGALRKTTNFAFK